MGRAVRRSSRLPWAALFPRMRIVCSLLRMTAGTLRSKVSLRRKVEEVAAGFPRDAVVLKKVCDEVFGEQPKLDQSTGGVCVNVLLCEASQIGQFAVCRSQKFEVLRLHDCPCAPVHGGNRATAVPTEMRPPLFYAIPWRLSQSVTV